MTARPSQTQRVYTVLKDGRPHTIQEIHAIVGTCRLNSRVAEVRKRYGADVRCWRAAGTYVYQMLNGPLGRDDDGPAAPGHHPSGLSSSRPSGTALAPDDGRETANRANRKTAASSAVPLNVRPLGKGESNPRVGATQGGSPAATSFDVGQQEAQHPLSPVPSWADTLTPVDGAAGNTVPDAQLDMFQGAA